MLIDAYELVRRFGELAITTPSEIYSSALLFAPSDSVLRKYYFHADCWELLNGDRTWSPLLCTLSSSFRTDVNCVVFSPKGTRIVILSGGRACLWNMHTGAIVQDIYCSIIWAAFSPDGEHLATMASDHTPFLWNAHTGQQLSMGSLEETRPLNLKPGARFLAYSPDGSYFISAYPGKAVNVRDARTRRRLYRIENSIGIEAVVFSHDGKYLAGRTPGDCAICIWSTDIWSLIGRHTSHRGPIRSMSFMPCGYNLASASDDKTIRVWNVVDGTQVCKPMEHGAAVRSIALPPDGDCLVSLSDDGTICFWNTRTGAMICEPFKLGYPTRDIYLSPDGSRLASIGERATVYLWDWYALWSAPPLPKDFMGHTQRVVQFACSPNGSHFATASEDMTVCIWSGLTGLLVRGPFHVDDVRISVLEFSPDGVYLGCITGASDHLFLWDVSAVQGVAPADDRLLVTIGEPLYKWIVKLKFRRWKASITGNYSFASLLQGPWVVFGAPLESLRLWIPFEFREGTFAIFGHGVVAIASERGRVSFLRYCNRNNEGGNISLPTVVSQRDTTTLWLA